MGVLTAATRGTFTNSRDRSLTVSSRRRGSPSCRLRDNTGVFHLDASVDIGDCGGSVGNFSDARPSGDDRFHGAAPNTGAWKRSGRRSRLSVLGNGSSTRRVAFLSYVAAV